MEIIGRITKDATVRTVKKNNRKVVSFTIAVNDYYKPKDAEKGTKVTTYIDCSHWMNPSIAKHLLQGTLVEVHGRIYATAYNDKEGKARANINCHVNTIKIHARVTVQAEAKDFLSGDAADDLPF